MASKELLCLLFVCFFALGGTTYCNYDSDCSIDKKCCAYNVCRRQCSTCSYDYQCGSNQLSYTRYCGRHRPTATTNGLNPHDDDATSTCSSAVELHPAFSRWIQPASSNRLQPVSSSWLPQASSRFQSGSSASLKLSTTNSAYSG